MLVITVGMYRSPTFSSSMCCSRHGCSTHAGDGDGRVFLSVTWELRDSGTDRHTEFGLHF